MFRQFVPGLSGVQAVAIGARARRLQDLVTLNDYFLSLLERALGYSVLVPQQLKNDEDEPSLTENLCCWLGLLDRAITAQNLRENLPNADGATTHSLLRYFVSKQSQIQPDCDKTDIIATHLYRNWANARDLHPAPRTDAFTTPEFARVPEFSGPLYAILSDLKLPELQEEHRLLLREFPFLLEEIEEFKSFEQLIDSGLIQRVRDIKRSFGLSLYHPQVLAVCAEYNVAVGRKFHDLFLQAVHEIKEFAATVQLRGGSVMARVNGDITVKQMTEVAEEALLIDEYERARPDFEKVSRFVKAVDRSLGRAQTAPVATLPGPAPQPRIDQEAKKKELEDHVRRLKETSITRAMASSISKHARSADCTFSLAVPLRSGSFKLSAAERDAFSADYAEENSFRGSYASAMIEIVSTAARMSEELQLLKDKRESAYLWMPHADSLAWLLSAVQQAVDNGSRMIDIAEQRGLKEKAGAMSASVEKLQEMAQQVRGTLQALEPSNLGR